VALAGFFLVSAAAIIVQEWQRFWFPWLAVGVVQIPAALAWSILAHGSRLHRDNRVLEMALAMSRAGTPVSDSPTGVTKAIVSATGGEYSPISISPFSDGRAWPGSASDGAPPPIPDHALIRCIGRGAYGEVWLARDVIGTYHAVKVVHRKTFKDDAPFEREFRGIQKFTPISRTHPGFVNILHVGRNDQAGYFYYIMELGDDENTGPQIDPNRYSPKNLARALARSGRMAVLECLRLSLDLTAALEHLHRQQLIHRDIKPSNIIFVNGMPKFADIGLVTDIGGTGHDVTYVGTAGYIAPEGPGTPAADVYSLAKVIYELSTGLDRSRFPELPTSIVEGVDDVLLFQLNKIILKACENDLAKRYHSAAEMQADLSRLVARDSMNPARRP
jgi:serine/threonine protein kinase